MKIKPNKFVCNVLAFERDVKRFKEGAKPHLPELGRGILCKGLGFESHLLEMSSSGLRARIDLSSDAGGLILPQTDGHDRVKRPRLHMSCRRSWSTTTPSTPFTERISRETN